MNLHVPTLIARKRDGETLDPAEIRKLVLDLAEKISPVPRKELEHLLDDGRARRKFDEIVSAHGGDPADLPKLGQIHHAPLIRDFPAPCSGSVVQVDAGLVGQAALQLGAGRARASDGVDHAVGFDHLVKCGEHVHQGQPLCRVHARTAVDFEIAEALLEKAIPRGDFGKWTRWYQEDGSTQVFRLFKGEENVHNARANAARTEAFSELNWKEGDWHQWSGTYTIIEPHGAAIFQAKNDVNDWSVQINMNSQGDVTLNHRRAPDQVIAKAMVGKPFHILVRDNGKDYEVHLDGRKVGAGVYARPSGKTSFRWGMYLGKNAVTRDAMIFVSGATVDGKEKN